MIYSLGIMEVMTMDSVGKMDTTNMDNVIKELNTWCMNYRGFINQVFSEQVTMEEKVTKLFWCVKKVCESQVEVMEQYNALYDYVMNYFSSLDVQKEIEDAVKKYIDNGTIGNLINDELLGEINTKVNQNTSDIGNLKSDVENMSNFRDILKQGGKRILFMGDSIGAGFGWWTNGDTSGDRAGKEGVMSIWQSLWPNNTYVNTAKLGCCLGDNAAGNEYPKIRDQIPQSQYDYIFIFCGINDVTVAGTREGGADYLGSMKPLLEAGPISQWDTAFNALYSLLGTIRSTYSDTKVFFCTEPSTEYNYYKYIQPFKEYKRITKHFGYYVLDLWDIFPVYNTYGCNHLFYDRVHPNHNGYLKLSDDMLCMIEREISQRNSDCSVGSNVINIYSPSMKQLGNIDYYAYLRYAQAAVPDIIRTLGDGYWNECFVFCPGNANFIPVKVEHVYGGAIWYITFYPTESSKFPLRFKSTGTITEVENEVSMSPTSKLSSYGITRICDIPISGTFYGSISDFTDLPSKWTGTLLCVVIAHVNVMVASDQPNGYLAYKWIEVVPYGSTERFYCRYIKNGWTSDPLIDYFTDTSLQPYSG